MRTYPLIHRQISPLPRTPSPFTAASATLPLYCPGGSKTDRRFGSLSDRRAHQVISHRKEFITIESDVIYSRCRVQTAARGIVLRDRVPGSYIKTKRQQVCHAGEFLVAEIDAKVGGYGIVPSDLNGAIVSSHYFLFQIDEHRLQRSFLGWYCRTRNFQAQVTARGSTNYAAIRPQDVLAYRIPLPPIEDQHRIAEGFDKVAALADRNREIIRVIERELLIAMMSEVFCVQATDTRQPNWA